MIWEALENRRCVALLTVTLSVRHLMSFMSSLFTSYRLNFVLSVIEQYSLGVKINWRRQILFSIMPNEQSHGKEKWPDTRKVISTRNSLALCNSRSAIRIMLRFLFCDVASTAEPTTTMEASGVHGGGSNVQVFVLYWRHLHPWTRSGKLVLTRLFHCTVQLFMYFLKLPCDLASAPEPPTPVEAPGVCGGGSTVQVLV